MAIMVGMVIRYRDHPFLGIIISPDCIERHKYCGPERHWHHYSVRRPVFYRRLAMPVSWDYHRPFIQIDLASMEKIGCSWSGGKDSCFALMKLLESGSELKVLVNMMNENGLISRSHGIPKSILQQQANAMNVPIVTIPTSWNDYEKNFTNTLRNIKAAHGVDTMVFGDIDLQAHRDWEEKVCSNAGLKSSLPLWQLDRQQLIYDMLVAGIETVIVSCNTSLGENFLGRAITESVIPEFEALGVDVCGENGEYHTLVVNCPLFKHRLKIPTYKKIQHENYWFIQWEGSVSSRIMN